MDSLNYIMIRGARQHNLANINLDLPRNKLIVITGLSGSGKSSLAFDTLYAEGQRRYVESLSAYARQFLEQMEKPDVDLIEGLSPAISIEQKTVHRNPRSTVGTVTEIYDYLRLLFARVGTPHCYKCGKVITAQTPQQIVDVMMKFPEQTKVQILAPVVRQRKGNYTKLFEEIKKSGFVRIRVDGTIYNVEDDIKLERYVKHDVDVVVDRLVIKPEVQKRLTDSVETALKYGKGLVRVWYEIPGQHPKEVIHSEHLSCIDCGISVEELEPRMFSFNNPNGACPACGGLGTVTEIDPDLVVPDPELSIAEGAIEPWSQRPVLDSMYRKMLRMVCEHYGESPFTPWKDLSEELKDVILYGSGDEVIHFTYNMANSKYETYKSFEGVIPNLERRYRDTTSTRAREMIEKYMTTKICRMCQGTRLKPEARAVKIGGKNIVEVTSMSVRELLNFFDNLELGELQAKIAERLLKEIKLRLTFLANVGLDYLTLDRSAGTLSGGESQRIRLASQIGSGLVGVIYVLDEPSIGLHPRDTQRLINTLQRLRDLGNTVIVVEHDETTIRSADYVVDLGPGAGIHGGRVVVQGKPSDIEKCENSYTGQYLSGKFKVYVPTKRRSPKDKWLVVRGASLNNLKNIDVAFPLGLFICVTGVSGSGKSSLVNETLFPAVQFALNKKKPDRKLYYETIEGLEHIDKIIDVDQSPIGRTPRSNPATYTGVFTPIRELFSKTPEARARGYTPGRFSFNVKGGRCEECEGNGFLVIEMQFLPDVYIPCETCKGKRYNRDTLQVLYKGKSVADVLDMTVEDALDFFKNIPSIAKPLRTLYEVGLGYIKLGQPATTLSGGEAQRVKLATELLRRHTGNTLYILDEPTTGLHAVDVDRLLRVLHQLVDYGNTVIVIEHNLEVIRTADWIIDLGPEGGEDGGNVVAVGPPEKIVKVKESYTGKFLREKLGLRDKYKGNFQRV
ncbi:MAG: excinuclease ABC subunit UvrA [Candidatus Hydrogenedentes bacterium]|nr:excinuclease ABC subunit UvrA [Candidatus Hydrogenedentota bacterium]